MPASVTAEYGQSFLLGEEHIAKIDEFIRKRYDGIPNFKLEYQVYRLDHALITYGTPAEVTAEQNNIAEGIESLRVFGRTVEEDDREWLDIRFSKKKGVSIIVNSQERDRALLLAADLKSYITSEVMNSNMTKIIRTH